MIDRPRYANWISFRPILKGFAIAVFFAVLAAVWNFMPGR